MGELNVNLCSGGLDSYLAWKLCMPGAENAYVRIGHRYQAQEMAALTALAVRDRDFSCTAFDGPQVGVLETPSGIIPCRNALLLLTAAAHYGLRRDADGVALWLGALRGEINSDKSPEFCAALQEALNISWRRQYWTDGVAFRVGSAVRAWTKAQLIRRYADAGGNPGVLGATRSCYAPGPATGVWHCGCCTACFKRWVAFRAAGVADPSRYARDPRDWPGAAEARARSLDGTYEPLRAQETLAAMETA